MKCKYHTSTSNNELILPSRIKLHPRTPESNFTTTLQLSTHFGSHGFEPTTTRSYSGNLNHSTTEQITSTDHIIVLLLPIWTKHAIKITTFFQPNRPCNIAEHGIEPGTTTPRQFRIPLDQVVDHVNQPHIYSTALYRAQLRN